MVLLERRGFFAALLDTRPCLKHLCLTVCKDPHTHLLAAIPGQLRIDGETASGEGPCFCWTFLGVLELVWHQLKCGWLRCSLAVCYKHPWLALFVQCNAMMAALVVLLVDVATRWETIVSGTIFLSKCSVSQRWQIDLQLVPINAWDTCHLNDVNWSCLWQGFNKVECVFGGLGDNLLLSWSFPLTFESTYKLPFYN